MKKKIALALAAIMTFAAAVPMTLMASSSNTVSAQFYGYDENTIVPQASLRLNNADVPTRLADIADTTATGIGGNLRIELKEADDANRERGFTIDLTNAEWAFITGGMGFEQGGSIVGGTTTFNTTPSTVADTAPGKADPGALAYAPLSANNYATEIAYRGAEPYISGSLPTDWDDVMAVADGTAYASGNAVPFKIEIDRNRPERANVTYYTGGGISAGARFEIPLVVKTKNKDVVTATITSGGTSYVSDQVVQLSAGGKGTKASISGVEEGTGAVYLKPIYIDENSIGSLKDGTFKVTAPKGYEFAPEDRTANTVVPLDVISTNPTVNSSVDVLNLGDTAGATWELKKDETVLEVTLTNVASTSMRGAVRLSGLILQPIDDVLKYNVNLAVTIEDIDEETGVTKQTLDVAKFVKASILYSAKDAETIKAGFRDQEVAVVTIEEQTSDSWWGKRDTILTLTDSNGDVLDDVKFTAIDFDNDNISGTLNDVANDDDHEGSKATGSKADGAYFNSDGNELTLTDLVVEAGKKGKLELTITLSPDLAFEGDVYLMLSAKDIRYIGDDYIQNGGIVKIATVKPTIAVETKSTSVQVGSQRIDVADIILSEIDEDNMFDRNKDISLLVGQYGDGTAANIALVPGFKAEVIEGDMKVELDVNSPYAYVTVDRVSIDDLSTIKLSGIQVNVNRSVPFGTYELYVAGSAIRDNSEGDRATGATNRDLFDNSGIMIDKYITVDTPSINTAFSSKVVVFNDGSANVVVNGVAQEMGAATENINGSLYVPLRFIAYALGAQEQDIVWSDLTRTVSVNLNGRQVTWTEGSAIYVSYGVSQAMNNGAVSCIINDRLYIPFRGFAEAFNIPVVWDEATQTATYNPAVNK